MINKIKEQLNKVLQEIRSKPDDNFVDEGDVDWDLANERYPRHVVDPNRPDAVTDSEREEDEWEDDRNPYKINSWRGGHWHCIRCGHELKEIAKDDKCWGSWWYSMLRDGTLYFLCPNDQCFHHGAPLALHHPIYGHCHPAGDSYSISWIK